MTDEHPKLKLIAYLLKRIGIWEVWIVGQPTVSGDDLINWWESTV